MWGLGYRAWVQVFGVQGAGFRVQDSGLWAEDGSRHTTCSNAMITRAVAILVVQALAYSLHTGLAQRKPNPSLGPTYRGTSLTINRTPLTGCARADPRGQAGGGVHGTDVAGEPRGQRVRNLLSYPSATRCSRNVSTCPLTPEPLSLSP